MQQLLLQQLERQQLAQQFGLSALASSTPQQQQPDQQFHLSLLASTAAMTNNNAGVDNKSPAIGQLQSPSTGFDVPSALASILQPSNTQFLNALFTYQIAELYKSLEPKQSSQPKIEAMVQPAGKINLKEAAKAADTSDVSSPRLGTKNLGSGLHMSPKLGKFKDTGMMELCKQSWKEPLEELQKNRKRKLLKPKPTTKRLKTARTSQYRGIIWDKNSRAWRAKLSVNGKLEHVGLFDDEKEAALAWDQRALQVRGERTRLNFPASSLASATHGLDISFKSKRIRKSQKNV